MEKEENTPSVQIGDESPITHASAAPVVPVANLLVETAATYPDTNIILFSKLSSNPSDVTRSGSKTKTVKCRKAKSVPTPDISPGKKITVQTNTGVLFLITQTLRSAIEAFRYGKPVQLHLTSESLPFGTKITIRGTSGNLPENFLLQQMEAFPFLAFALQSAVGVSQNKFTATLKLIEKKEGNSPWKTDDENASQVPVDSMLAEFTTAPDPESNARSLQRLQSNPSNAATCSNFNSKDLGDIEGKPVLIPQKSSLRKIIGDVGRLVLSSQTLRCGMEALGCDNPGQLHLTSESLSFGIKIIIRSTAGNVPVLRNSPLQKTGTEVFLLQSALVEQRGRAVNFNSNGLQRKSNDELAKENQELLAENIELKKTIHDLLEIQVQDYVNSLQSAQEPGPSKKCTDVQLSFPATPVPEDETNKEIFIEVIGQATEQKYRLNENSVTRHHPAGDDVQLYLDPIPKTPSLSSSGSSGSLELGTALNAGIDDLATESEWEQLRLPEDPASTSSSSSNSNSGVSDPDSPDPDLEAEHEQHSRNTNSEVRNLPGCLQQPSTISSKATPKSSEATPSLSSSETNDVPASFNLFQSITSSVGQVFVAQQQTPTAGPSSASGSILNFVFGSNTDKRVIAAANSTGESAGLPNGVSSAPSFTGTFPVAGASAGLQPTDGEGSIHYSTESQQLHFQGSSTESLRLSGGNEACFASLSTAIGEQERKFDEQEQYISTGEEDESNVLQLSCRLFVYDARASVWVERRRGQLRLNDKVVGEQYGNGAIEHSRGSTHLLGAGREEEDFLQQRRMQSRIIVRTKGSLRLMLNSNVFSGMKVERPSEKSVRFTALDNGTIKIFTVQSTANEAEVLYTALECRVRALVALEALIPQTHSIQPQAIAGQAQHSSNNAIPRESAGRGDVDSESEGKNPKKGTSPPKKNRLDLPVEKKDDFSDSGTTSPTMTTADGEPLSEQNDTEDGSVAGVIFHSSGMRSTVVPSIQVDKPESWSDEED